MIGCIRRPAGYKHNSPIKKDYAVKKAQLNETFIYLNAKFQ